MDVHRLLPRPPNEAQPSLHCRTVAPFAGREAAGNGRAEEEYHAKDGESAAKLLTAFVRTADEGTTGKLIIEAMILLSARSESDGGKVLRTAAQAYGVDTDAVALKVKQEFAAKEKARKGTKPELKPVAKAKRAA